MFWLSHEKELDGQFCMEPTPQCIQLQLSHLLPLNALSHVSAWVKSLPAEPTTP